MLKLAKLYEEQLNKKLAENVAKPENKFYSFSYIVTKLNIDDNFWDAVQFVSVDKNDEVVGLFSARYERPENYIGSISCFNFKKPSILFSKDLLDFLNYLVKVLNVPKIRWTVIIGNPIEKSYDNLCNKFGGRIVGIEKYHTLINGKYYDTKIYEWINDYYECSSCSYKQKKEEEIICKECGVGKMIYHNPFIY